MNGKKCESCAFYQEFDDDVGTCYRYPSVFVGAAVTGEADGTHSSSAFVWDKRAQQSRALKVKPQPLLQALANWR